MIDQIAEQQNSLEETRREIDMLQLEKKGSTTKIQKLEEKYAKMLNLIGRMDDLQKGSQLQEKILSEMRGQLVSL